MAKKEDIDKVIRLMHGLAHSFRARDPRPWLNLELTREQLRVIFLLSMKGQASPSEVAETFGVPKANVTSVIDRLVGKGMIDRQENPDDRRSYILSLTKEGKKQIEKLHEIGTAHIRKVLGKMPDNAVASLHAGLESLIKVLKEEG